MLIQFIIRSRIFCFCFKHLVTRKRKTRKKGKIFSHNPICNKMTFSFKLLLNRIIMKNYVSLLTRFVVIVPILSLLSCGNLKLNKNDDSSRAPIEIISNEDNCCDLKYPSIQAEVSGIDLFQKQFQITSFRDPSTGNFKYKLNHSPSSNYETVSQAYANYVNALYPCATGTGSTWRLSKGNFGGGHTARQVTRENWIGFTSGSTLSTMAINNPDFWTNYFEPPISIGASATPAINGGLSYNEVYSLEYGFWINGCNSLTEKEKKCLGYHTFISFRIQVDPNPLRSAKSKSKIIIEFLDKNEEVISKQELELELE